MKLKGDALKSCLEILRTAAAGMETEQPPDIKYINPKDPRSGILYVLLPLKVKDLPKVKALPWIRRLELPDKAHIDQDNPRDS